MKHFYSQIKNCINIALFLGIFLQSYLANSQSTLAAGDLVFTGYDATVTPSASASDSYSFVLLTPISNGTVISFSDRGYTGSGWIAAGLTEGSVTWTSSGALAMGTEILIKGLTASVYDPATSSLVANGTVTRTEGTFLYGLSLSTVGDQIIAFQGGAGSISAGGVTLLTGLSYARCDGSSTAATWDSTSTCTIGPSTSVIPPGLGANAFYLGSTTIAQSAKFTGTGPFANAAAIKAAVLTTGNWQVSATALTMPSTAPFVGVPPTVTNPPNRTLCVGGSTTFPVTATDANSYQWQVNDGSGFVNITNGAPYSNATTATLTVSPVTAAMSGYQYRCTVTGVGSVSSVSGGTLTVSNITVTTTLQTNVSCKGGNNGSVTLSASGGIGPYTYSSSPAGISSATPTNLSAGTYTVTVTDNISCSKTHTVTITEPLAALTASTSTTPVSCFGGNNGTATVTPAGGTAGYTYLWSNPGAATTQTATGLTAGTYSVTVTDSKSCTLTINNINVGQPSAIVDGTATTTPVSCFGATNGTATVVATGGNGGYTYSWSPSGGTGATASGLAAGTYSVIITDSKSCSKTVNNIIVGGPAVLDGTASTTPATCFGGATGTATVTPTGGTPGYTYLWSPSGGTGATATGLAAGTYSVTITDANTCAKTVSGIVVGQSTAIISNLVTTPVSCNGGTNGTATVAPSGGAGPYTYLWSTNATSASISNLSQGNYSVTITDGNGCPKTENFTITEPAVLTASAGSQTNVSCNGGTNGSATVNLTGGTGAYTYSWSPSGGTGATASGLAAGTYIVTVTDANSCTTTQSFTLTEPAVLAASAGSQTNVSCNGGTNGSATVNVTGGTAGYTYSWSPSGGTAATASGLAAGTYIVTVTDAKSCTTTQSFTLTEPNALIATAGSQTNVSCNGGTNGSATVNVTGGTPGYTYSWSPSGGTAATTSGLAAGTYIVTVTDANSCTATQSFTLTEPAVLTASAGSQTNVSCNGGTNGSATVNVTGGTGAYTYSWSPSGGTGATASGLAAGTYIVTVTDANSCTATQSFTITEPAVLTASAGSQTNVSCNGGTNGSATVNVTGGTGAYTYSWSPSGGTAATASGLAAGTYAVTVTDANSCNTTQSFTLTEPSVLTASAGSQTNVSCNGGTNGSATVNVTGGTGAYTYSWSPSGGTAATASGLAAGTYIVTVTDANSCTTTQSFTLTEPNALVATAGSQTNVSCNGGTNGSATVNVTGGTGAFTYSWSPSGGTGATASGLAAGTYVVTVTDANSCTTTQSFTITEPNALIATAGSQTNVSCNGGTNGSATVNVTGGTAGYTYLWSPSGGTASTASGLAAGTYIVTVTDANSCTTTQSFTITEPNALVATAGSQTNVSCNGGTNGSATVNVTGGTPGYTYLWSPSGGTGATASGLAAGTYIVTVTDANSCTTTQSFTITEPNILVATAGSQTNISCNGGTNGSATVNVTGGTPGYTYLWAPSGQTGATASGLVAGTYIVTVTDANSCTTTQSFTLTEPNVLVASAGSQTNVSCNGGTNGSATVNVTGGTAGYTYLWSPSGGTAATATGLAAGTYTVTVTDANSCTTTQSFTITEPNVLVATAGSQTNVSCNGGTNGSATVNVTGGTPGYTYLWSPSGQTGATASALAAGTYIVTVTDANSCTTTQSFTITEPNILVATAGSQTNVSCNGGTNGSATVNVTGGTPGYTYLWSPSGQTGATASALAAGTYIVTVTDANSCTTTQSFTITEPNALVATAGSQTNVSCNGGTNGSATVNVTGGTAGYTYLWSPSGGTAATASGLAAGTYSVTVTDANSCTATQSFTITEPNVLVATEGSQTNVSCNGGTNGSATVNVTGGTPGYTYLWSPSGQTGATASGLVAGTYIVTVTDANSCTTTQSFTLTEPAVLTASAGSQTNVSCNGGTNGSATVNVTGGTTGYTYSWSPSGGTAATASGLAAGTYIVTVTDANSCSTTQSFTITEPNILIANPQAQTNVFCNGASTGSATVNVSGGTPGYTYLWSPSGGTAATATGLAAGTYTVTITDANSCTITQTFTLTEPAALVANPVSQTNIGCRGEATGSATVAATGGTGAYTYSWSPSGGTAATATGLAAGTYTVTVTDDNLCQTTYAFTITQPAAILSAITASTSVSCFGGSNGSASVAVSGGTPAYTYAWAPSGDTGASISGKPAGNYTCTITDANGCSIVENITIGTPNVFSATVSQTDVSCNGGTNGSATITPSGATAPFTYTWSPSGGNSATATGLAAGNYTVLVQDANTCVYTVNVTIGEPATLAVTPSQTNVLCNGGATGTATVTVSGGTPGYTYLWSPSGGTAATALGLATGNYSCLVTDSNGCTLTQNFTITEPAILSATTSTISATCATGGQASVNVSGGTLPYTYLWSPSGGTGATATGLTAGNYSCIITDGNGCTITKNVTITTTNTLVAATSQTDVSCNGGNTGSVTVFPSGATGPFTYVWSPSGGNASTASNLTAGNYSVTITSANGCSIVKNFTLTEPNALIATAGSQTNISCNGGSNGSATVNVSGGTPGYTYLWLPSGGTAATASGLTAGTYTVTVTDDNNCTTTQSFTLTEPNALIAIAGSQTNISCNGGTNGSATVNVTGGTGAYTYSWSPSGGTAATASGLAAGTYTVTVTDANSCTTTQSFTITEPNVLVATAGSQTNVSCNGGTNGSATVNVTGGTAGYTYSWSPSGGTAATASGLTSGTYTVTVTDANSCTTTQSFTLTEPNVLVATAGSQTNVSCNGGTNGSATVNVTGGTAGYTYSWSPSGGTAATASGLAAGTYTVTVTDANSCTTTQSFTLTEPNALIATATTQTNISCNGGSNGSATVNVTGGSAGYTYSWSPSGGTAATASGLTAGTYTVTVTDANSCTTTQSFTITEPNVLVATAGSQTNVSCNGGTNGSATVNVTGGTAGYTYSWSPSGGTAATATGLTAGTYTVTVTDANSCTTTQSFTLTEPNVLIATAGTQTNVSCNGGSNGSATVNVTGGTPGYTYSWSPSGGTAATASGLTAGTYTVTVTDTNSCTTTQSFTLTEPNALIATVGTQTNISCNGGSNGSATVNVTGGTPGYTYSWSPSGGTTATATGLTAGTYTVTVTDANSCTTTQSFTLTEPNALIATAATQTNISCNGGSNGSATVNVTGGTAGYTYSWSPSGGTAATASGLAAGTYTVTVTDANSCTTTQSFTITEPNVLVASAGSQTNVSCNGGTNGSATVSITGGTAGYTYSWSPSGGTAATATGLTAGTYTVTVTDANSCTTTQSFTLTEPNVLVATAGSQTNVSCNGGTNGSATVNVTGGTAGYTYSWSPSGGTAATASGLAAGTYTVTVTDANSCTTTQSFTLTEPNALIATVGTQTNISCNGGSNGSATVNVTGGTGAYTYSWSPSGGTAATATGLAAGTYTVTVTDANSCTTTQSFTLTEPNALIATATTQTNVSCNGGSNGSATINVTGGTGAYTYAWAPTGGTAATATGLIAGTYIVTVTDANSCTTTQSFTITEPNVLVASAGSQTNVSCNGGTNGSATVSVTGGTAGYTYSWSPSGGTAATATGLTAGTYTVTVTDANSCTTTQSFTITEPNALIATAATQTNISCNGGSNGSATVSVIGGTGAYTYAWSPSGGTAATASGLAAGTYTVTVTDANSCTTTQSFTLTEPNALIATASQTNISCNGGSNGSATVNVTGGTGAYTYAWSPAGGTSATASGLAAGTYIVTVTDANSCTTTQSFTITEPAVLTASIATQTNISCSGLSDGAATINVAGGVTPYTYSWSNGSTTKDISGLTAGSYTLTVTDANNCTTTQTVVIITIPDTTAPVPNVATLPVISNYCAVLASEIAIPTANDNCSGVVTATTSDALTYNTPGTYTITWTYTDASGNTATQTQTIKVLTSPLDQVTLTNAVFTYDGNPHTIQVSNLPAGATVNYSIVPATGAGSTATNAGTYTINAIVTPSSSSANCANVSLTATLTINKAAQQITFNPIPVKIVGNDTSFQLDASSNSGLPVYYTFTSVSAIAPATVSTNGLVNIIKSGTMTITAHQDGDANYLPASNVSQPLVIKSKDATIQSITIGTQIFNNPLKDIKYVIGCGETSLNIKITTEDGLVVTPSKNFTLQFLKAGIYQQNIVVTSEDGTVSAVYTVTIEKQFNFNDIVVQKFNNVLLVNNNPLTNGGYEFVGYQWFKNGQVIGTGQYYSAGNSTSDELDPTASYMVKVTTKDGKVLQTCASQITLLASSQARLYPNPIEEGKAITIEADFPTEELENMQINVYSLSGSLITTVRSSTAKTEVQLPPTSGNSMYLVVVQTPNIQKSFKVVVKK